MLDQQLISVNEQSAFPSGISHSFDSGYAIAYGVNEAIMIGTLQHFIICNANRGHNFRQGRFWTYDTVKNFRHHFPYWSTQTVRTTIASLIRQGVIIKGEFNDKWSDRTQWYAFKDQPSFIKNIVIPKTPSPLPNPDLLKSTTAICGNQQLTDVEINNCYNDTILSASSISSNTSYKVPEKDSPKSKKSQEKQVFSDQVHETTQEMLKLLEKNESTYRPPKDLTPFLIAVQKMIEIEKQDVQVIMKAFEWAVSNNIQTGDFKGWQAVICTNTVKGRPTNPAEIFHRNLSKINSQSKSRKDRAFAPCSDESRTDAIMKEMSARAI